MMPTKIVAKIILSVLFTKHALVIILLIDKIDRLHTKKFLNLFIVYFFLKRNSIKSPIQARMNPPAHKIVNNPIGLFTIKFINVSIVKKIIFAYKPDYLELLRIISFFSAVKSSKDCLLLILSK